MNVTIPSLNMEAMRNLIAFIKRFTQQKY